MNKRQIKKRYKQICIKYDLDYNPHDISKQLIYILRRLIYYGCKLDEMIAFAQDLDYKQYLEESKEKA